MYVTPANPQRGSDSVAEAGNVLRVFTSGGGGYGDPGDRDEERVREVLADGLISGEFATEHYLGD